MAGYKVTSEAIHPKQLTPAEMFLQVAQYMVAQEKLQIEQELLKQQLALEAQRTDELKELVQSHDAELERVFKPNGDYYTVRGYAKLKGFSVSISDANKLGRKASSLSRTKGVPIEKMKDPRYGEVGCYSEHVLNEIFV
jgi:hypothetical protein